MMTIFYEVHRGLYVNLTNQCPCACTFCLRNSMDRIGRTGPLWLDHTPSLEEVLEEMKKWDFSKYDEVVFCGFGEPTCAWDVLLEVAKIIKRDYGTPIRINTNGLGNLVNGRDILPDMKGLIDTLSISLNTPSDQDYLQTCRPKFGLQSHQAMLDFAREAKAYVPNIVMTTVDTTLTKEEEAQCAQICKDLGVNYRIRAWESADHHN
jgi:radical SAM enzyme (TIGR04100 family)